LQQRVEYSDVLLERPVDTRLGGHSGGCSPYLNISQVQECKPIILSSLGCDRKVEDGGREVEVPGWCINADIWRTVTICEYMLYDGLAVDGRRKAHTRRRRRLNNFKNPVFIRAIGL